MERAVALKKLTKILGKGLRYRVDPAAPDPDARALAREQAKRLSVEHKATLDARDARQRAVLAADAEYQRLVVEERRLRDAKDRVWGMAHHHKIMVGVVSGIFFHVKAQGSSWEDVITQLETKR